MEVAHEALIRHWSYCNEWVANNREDLFVFRRAEVEADEWQRQGYDLKYLWHADRLKQLQGIVAKRDEKSVKENVRLFMAPWKKLCERLENPSLSHLERLTIGQYLAALGDPRPGVGVRKNGVPDIAWVDIPGSSVKVAKYLVTNAQFQAFIDADDGYNNDEWWVSMRRWPNGPSEGRCIESNAPRENVSWFMAVAFCRWMSHRTRLAIRLPSESEWQQAKDGGNPQFIFPWGLEWDSSRCNLAESKLQRAISVGMYPAGATRQGLLDMVGNVSEWCLNQYKDSGASEAIETHADNAVYTICGGSYDTWSARGANASFRHYERADSGFMGVGFRLAQDIEP